MAAARAKLLPGFENFASKLHRGWPLQQGPYIEPGHNRSLLFRSEGSLAALGVRGAA